uniref:hypothetical protein n=1 Tax=Clostridium sp. 12(A) TaxID=1163671 RepID=UPI0004641E2A|nr:hypothetical protein [Clostridium sp. 12(A)]
MLIWFKCEKENLMLGVETDTKPTLGDTVLVKRKEYNVDKVTWCLEQAPVQSGLLIKISPID